jgi:hypothetical protein
MSAIVLTSVTCKRKYVTLFTYLRRLIGLFLPETAEEGERQDTKDKAAKTV